jgi:hypothetical protein
MLPKDENHPLGLLDHVEWLHSRLMNRRGNLLNVFKDGNGDSAVIGRALEALAALRAEWPSDEDDGYDHVLYGPG